MESSAPRAPKATLSYNEALDLGVQLYLSLGKPASEVITDTLLDDLTPEAFREMARRGWYHEVNNRIHYSRGMTDDKPQSAPAVLSPVRVGSHPISGRNPTGAWRPLDIPWQGADGAIKRLSDFTLADIRSFRENCQAQRTGWDKKDKFGERVEQYLSANKKAVKISDLGKFQVAELSKLAKDAWS